MKKTLSILSAILLLSSCSKEDINTQGTVKYYLNTYTEYNTKITSTRYSASTNYIQLNFKINDSVNGAFVLSTQNNVQYCHSNIVLTRSNGQVIEEQVDYKMKGKYYITNKRVSGMFTGSGSNYIEFTNYPI